MVINDVIARYEWKTNLDDPRNPLRLEYENHQISTTAFCNHHDVHIQRPGLPKVTVPIQDAREFYLGTQKEATLMYVRHTALNHYDEQHTRLGTVRLEDIPQAQRFITVANGHINNKPLKEIVEDVEAVR